MNKKSFLKSIVFLLLFAVCFIPVNKLFSQPTDRRNYQWIAGFYEEPAESLDAVYVGSSNVYAFWNPLLAWENYGIAVYPYSSNDQPFSAAPYLIDEVHKTQPDALIIVNLNSLWDTLVKETNMHYLLDNMPFSLNKLKLTKHLADAAGYSFSDSMEFYLPLLRYHERWSELAMSDFDFRLNGLKGASIYYNHMETSKDITALYRTGTEPMAPEEAVLDTLNELLDYCDENQVNILFVTVPRAEKKEESANTFLYLNELIADRGYPVLDLMDKLDEIGMETEKDYYNDTHTNIHGSIKFTRYLSEYLMENYDFRDKRGEEAYSSWDAGRKKYSAYMNPYVLDIEHDTDHRAYDLAEPGTLRAKKQDTGAAVTWKAVEGAEGYCVYKKTGSGGWKRLAEVTETQFTDTQEMSNDTWSYRVVPFRYNENGEPCYGKFSYAGVSIKP